MFENYLQFLTRKTFAINSLDARCSRYLLKKYISVRYLTKYLPVKKGFFVEAGANDGLVQSNSYLFEKYYGWNGILVEPIPEYAEKSKINRPNAVVENYALVSADFKEKHIEMSQAGLMSMVSGAMGGGEKERIHLTTGRAISGVNGSCTVPVITLTELLKRNKVTHIDFFSLDVEGYELEVLKGLDLDLFPPDWMLIEARYKDDIDSYLKGTYEEVERFSQKDVLYKKAGT